MFFELIGTIIAGVAAGLIVWAINRTIGKRLPKWLAPVAAGTAMLAATISSEYSWYNRTVATLPPGSSVAYTVEEQAFYRPWTYAKPYISRFAAVDLAAKRTHPEQPGQRIVDLFFFGRWAKTAKVPILFDCTGGRRADIVDGIEFGDNGTVLNADWVTMPDDDPIQQAACKEV
ncbi:hypothetical protein [Actibacterium sp. 188UL27-1]|uniref:hypothetical protein n=1 Tax=Actibacterium sp. 188UL27-1 TaxID=2786961 RepID=UPI00195E8F21|nr:hypothetical protein [Actibacterium sp. 188UL27-1]MBM7068717.1 hypothetical protein [Actibacterium sp. 188UL27-1]